MDKLKVLGKPLAARYPGQCVLVTDYGLLRATGSNLWLHNLFIRQRNTGRIAAPTMLHVQDGALGLWLTGVTVQGEGNYQKDTGAGCSALEALAPVYAEGASPVVTRWHAWSPGVRGGCARPL